MSNQRQLVLNLFIYPGGHHEAAWRYKGSEPDRILDITHYQELAQRAEASKFDAIFFADGPALADNVRYAQRLRFEPITWLAAIAAVTSRIGLIATASTTYTEPYNLARLFASLDHLSRGRAGWNIVTTGAQQAAQNFGLPEHPPHHERYERAREYLDVISRLWDSWEDDALVNDPASGIFADTSKIHTLDHIGKHFRVRGPLNISRAPQGRPVYVQAGSSDDGRAFAARFAEAVFTAHQTLESATAFYADIKRQARTFDRSPDEIKILPGISPFIGSTQAEADRLQNEFNELIQPEFSLTQLRQMIGLDLTGYDLDGPVPRDLIDTASARGVASRFKLVVDIIDREKPTIRQLVSASPARAATGSLPARRRRSRTTSRPGSRAARPMASMLCRHGCPAASIPSPSRSSRSCASAACSARTTPARPCASTTDSRGRPASTPAQSRRLPETVSAPTSRLPNSKQT